MKPATMAVKRPVCGSSPLAIAKAMANGSATTPTVMPAPRSFKKTLGVVSLQAVHNTWFEWLERFQKLGGGHVFLLADFHSWRKFAQRCQGA